MFQNGSAAAVGSVVGNAPLVKKVWFPREILPLAAVGAAFVDFLIQSSVLVSPSGSCAGTSDGAISPHPDRPRRALLFTAACGVWLAAVNVKYRDIQHFLAIALMVWFWATPIIYRVRADRQPAAPLRAVMAAAAEPLRHHLLALPAGSLQPRIVVTGSCVTAGGPTQAASRR